LMQNQVLYHQRILSPLGEQIANSAFSRTRGSLFT
jgi:hypothetical protein